VTDYERMTQASMDILGIRSSEEAAAKWPAIVAELQDLVARVKGQEKRRTNGDLAAAACWARRSLHDCRVLTDDQRDAAEELLVRLHDLVVPKLHEWRPAAAPKRSKSRPLIPSPSKPGQIAADSVP
jgi:hypothetical protein